MFKFQRLKKNNTPIDSMPMESRQALAPRMLHAGDPSYKSVEELRIAMSMPECRNIALTGVFGSGKSSVINTYLASENAPKNVLRISLSNLIPLEQELKSPEEKIKYENEVEYKIFQQIIHKADYRKTTQSHFFRINMIDGSIALRLSLFCLLFFVCFIIAFEPKILQLQSFYDAYHKILGENATKVNIIADIVAVCVMFVQMTIVLYFAIPKFYKFRISNLKASEIEINFDDEEKLFCKRLGEILYYLKAGKYDAVIFEDLDRISHPQELFLKLREINILLNESDYFCKNKRTIRFVYAVKDDLFTSEVRTKFFDYIVPVIPVVDEFNSGEYMICHCKDVLNNIKEIDIKTLGLFIPRMRDLVNILNEYRLYKDTLNENSALSAKKLLATIIYKNLYPADYSLLHEKKGCLYNVFSQKDVFSKNLTMSLEAQRSKIIEDIKSDKDSIFKMRKTVLDVLSEKHNISQLSIAGIYYSLDEVAQNGSLYDDFEDDKIEMCFVQHTFDNGGEYRKYTYEFDEIRASVDSDETYYEQIDTYKSSLASNERKSRELDRQIASIRNMSLGKIMRQIGKGNETLSAVRRICKEDNDHNESELSRMAETIHGLIRNGYISEDYSTYISYTYYGSYGEEEFKFFHNVIQGTPLNYDYKLTKVKAFINDIQSENYDSQSILNYDLANYIFTNEGTEAQKQNFINTARKYPDFVIGYEMHPKHKDEFYERLFLEWNNCLQYIQSLPTNTTKSTLLRLYFRVATQSVQLQANEVEFVNSLYPFICEHLLEFELSKIKCYMVRYRIRFTQLIQHNAITADLFSYVLQYHLFEINTHNLLVIYGEDFKTQAVTKILNGSEELRRYITKDIELLLKNIPNESKNEAEPSLVYMANQETLTDEQLTTILEGQKFKIKSLADVPLTRYEFLLKGDFVIPSWDNVRCYFASDRELSIIISFINQHAKELATTRLTDGDEKLQVDLFGNNTTLEIEAYKTLVNSCEFIFSPEDIDGVNSERLEILLDNGLLEYSTAFNAFMSKYPPYLLAKYIIRYFDQIETDTNGANFENSNLLGIEILESSLPDEKKALFLKKFAWLETEENKDEGCDVFARMICEFYLHNDCSDADYSLIVKALENYNGDNTWLPKIELINKIHRSTEYSEKRSTQLVNTLGVPYTELNTSGGERTELDNNPQNNELVDYLRDKGRFIHQKRQKGDKIRVFYR